MNYARPSLAQLSRGGAEVTDNGHHCFVSMYHVPDILPCLSHPRFTHKETEAQRG